MFLQIDGAYQFLSKAAEDSALFGLLIFMIIILLWAVRYLYLKNEELRDQQLTYVREEGSRYAQLMERVQNLMERAIDKTVQQTDTILREIERLNK